MESKTVNGDADYVIENNIIRTPDFDYDPDPRGLGYVFMDSMKRFKDKVAQYIADTDEVDTFGELLQRSVRTAIKMTSKGLKKGDLISICSHNHKNTCVPYIASIFLGLKTASLDPTISVRETLHLLNLVKPKMIFASDDGIDLLERVKRENHIEAEVVAFGENENYTSFGEFIEPQIGEEDFEIVPPESLLDTVAVLFSSGTTGLPKGICLNHYTLLVKCWQTLPNIGTNGSGDSVYLCSSAFYWISAHLILICSMMSGSARVVWKKFDVSKFWYLVDKYKATLAFIAPGQCIDVSRTKIPENCDVSTIRVFITGGGPIPHELLPNLRKMLPHAWIGQGYGATEVGGLVAGFTPRKERDDKLMMEKLSSCGLPVPGLLYKIVDPETNEILGPNQQGELRVKSKAMTTGYFNPESGNPFDENGWLKTGDLVYYDDDMCFYIVDRLKEMLKYKSFQIAPAMLEKVIFQHPAVKDAVVVGLPHPEDGDLPTAIIIPYDDIHYITTEDIRKFVDERVEDKQKLRGGVRFIQQFPVTPSGKVKRRDLKIMVIENKI